MKFIYCLRRFFTSFRVTKLDYYATLQDEEFSDNKKLITSVEN